ncbi:MAG: hypothetical protein E6Q97_37395 [Desulfurellales bacterium]|nr:MAG: hypothetical protein E6Q97_37395 [Desulfurellales bacterium]
MHYYSIHTGDGGELSVGTRSYGEAVRAAREFAALTGGPVYISGGDIAMDPDDDEDAGEEVRP